MPSARPRPAGPDDNDVEVARADPGSVGDARAWRVRVDGVRVEARRLPRGVPEAPAAGGVGPRVSGGGEDEG